MLKIQQWKKKFLAITYTAMGVSIVTLYVNYSIRSHRNHEKDLTDTRKISFGSFAGTTLYVDSETMIDNPTLLQLAEQQKRQHREGKVLTCRKLLQSHSRRSYLLWKAFASRSHIANIAYICIHIFHLQPQQAFPSHQAAQNMSLMTAKSEAFPDVTSVS